MVNKFALNNQSEIQKQLRLVGASLDWSREAFTLDKKREVAVRTAFKGMYDAGLIYRGNRVINWDPKGQTTIADDEIVYEERKSKMYTFKYSKDFPISISTTRPETKVGDSAVAVHPSDERYQKYIGKKYSVDFCGVKLHLEIIADESVEKDFGTGALGVTPAHSVIDSEIAKRHNLPEIQVINEYAKMMVGDERILNKKTTEAREAIVKWLRDEGLLEKEEEVTQNIGTAERTGGIIEPLPKLQWFVDVNKEFVFPHSNIKGIESGSKTTLKQIMKKSVENGQVSITPEYFNKTYFHWIENLRDWCISRQIFYGHQIPVWYKGDEVYNGLEAPTDAGWTQDQDTLDTWFSSGLWSFSTLGWPFDYAHGKPAKGSDLATYHPTTLINPGYEILFPWVARMIMMSGFHLGEIPFKTVYLHGVVRDSKGKKFSKSLNNGVEPEEIINQFGTDALRMSMIIGITPGGDLNFDTQKVKAYKNFANKLWNITRFVLSSTEDIIDNQTAKTYTDADNDLFLNFQKIAKEITKDLDNYHLHLAGEKIYHYIWHEYADKIIEDSKQIISNGSKEEALSRKYLLLAILKNSLRILHPFMPFVTEEIWQTIHSATDKNLLMIEKWPTS